MAQLEHDVREAQTKMHDSLHERNFLQVQLDKMETEKNEMQTRLSILTQERNSLENQVAELQDLNRYGLALGPTFARHAACLSLSLRCSMLLGFTSR